MLVSIRSLYPQRTFKMKLPLLSWSQYITVPMYIDLEPIMLPVTDSMYFYTEFLHSMYTCILFARFDDSLQHTAKTTPWLLSLTSFFKHIKFHMDLWSYSMFETCSMDPCLQYLSRKSALPSVLDCKGRSTSPVDLLILCASSELSVKCATARKIL